MSSFKKCPKGHIYRTTFARCPYCDGSISGFSQDGNTQLLRSEASCTMMLDTEKNPSTNPEPDTKTVLLRGGTGNTSIDENPGSSITREFGKDGKRMVGWLVSYTLNPLGVDFKIYEGKNFIGKDADCTVCIPDQGVSGKHATLLFRSGKFRLRDNLSSNGTFVNGQDLEDETYTLHDGDIIQIGNTQLMFKSSLAETTCETGIVDNTNKHGLGE